MQMIPVPLYDKDMTVQSYLFRYQTDSPLVSTARAAGMYDGANKSPVLELLNLIGLDAFTLGKEVFVPIKYISMLSGLAGQCRQPARKVIFLLEDMPPAEDPYLSTIHVLKSMGYRFGVHYLTQLEKYDEVLKEVDYCFLSQRDEAKIKNASKLRAVLKRRYPHLKYAATQIHTQELFRELERDGYDLYESKFYKAPVTQGEADALPLEANARRLQTLVEEDNFELKQVAAVVKADPSLAISLLQTVSGHQSAKTQVRAKSIGHAVAMLGQREIQAWATDKVAASQTRQSPDEIIRVALIRAKFAENLAPIFGMAAQSEELFLMGMLSVMDIMLQLPMDEALAQVRVSEPMEKALLEQDGPFAPVLLFLAAYEGANWSSVSRKMILYDMSAQALSDAYIGALTWYRDLNAEA